MEHKLLSPCAMYVVKGQNTFFILISSVSHKLCRLKPGEEDEIEVLVIRICKNWLDALAEAGCSGILHCRWHGGAGDVHCSVACQVAGSQCRKVAKG